MKVPNTARKTRPHYATPQNFDQTSGSRGQESIPQADFAVRMIPDEAGTRRVVAWEVIAE
jgi:hypothetical protein